MTSYCKFCDKYGFHTECHSLIPEWIKCSDRMPELSKNIIVTDGGNIGYIIEYCPPELDDDYYISGIPDHTSHSMTHNSITHWMPLPEAPIADIEE